MGSGVQIGGSGRFLKEKFEVWRWQMSLDRMNGGPRTDLA